MTHYIIEGGQFAAACNYFLLGNPVDLIGDHEMDAARKAKAGSKTKYRCPGCGVNAWAKPNVVLFCGECSVQMT